MTSFYLQVYYIHISLSCFLKNEFLFNILPGMEHQSSDRLLVVSQCGSCLAGDQIPESNGGVMTS